MAVRLGPIYDALDTGDNKGSLRLIRNAESRYGPDPILYALKALALVRSDRLDEARDACRSFLKCRPAGPVVLETALVVFKELDQLDWNRQAYEAAVEQRPNDEMLLTGLYFAYMREWSFLKQQQTAMRLFRVFAAEKYLRWVTLTIEMQNGALQVPSLKAVGDDIPAVDPQSSRLLQLASMMLEKNTSPDAMSLPCLFQYVRVLRRLGRHEAVIKTLHRRDESDPDLQFILAESWFNEGMFNHASAIAKNLIENRNPDDWRYLRLYVNAAIREKSDSDGPIAFLRGLRSLKIRGPWLAEIYATNVMKLDADNHVVEYFQHFGNKKCFFADVQPYLQRIDNIESTLNRMEIAGDALSDDLIRRRVSYELCWRALLCHRTCSDDDLRTKAQNLFDLFIGSVNPNKEKTEFGVGDDLCMLCAFTLIDLYNRNESRPLLLQSVVVLTIGLRSSPHNFQFLFLLIRLYAQLGAFLGAFEHYSALDTKSIQLETLTHLVQNDALRYGFTSHAVALAGAVISHHEQYQRDAPDLAILCYMKDNLDQALEFTQFRERMRRSFRLAESRQIVQFFSNYLDKDVTCLDMRMELSEDQVNGNDLLINDDFTLLLHPDKDCAAALNQSSSCLHERSWHQDCDKARPATLRFFRTVLSLTNAIARSSPTSIRQGVAELTVELAEISIADLSSPVSPYDGFTQQHWRFCVLVLECSANVSKTWESTLSVIMEKASEDFNLNELWSDVRRQTCLLEMMSQQLSHTLLETIDSATNEGQASLTVFVYFASRWCTLFLDQCYSLIPAKRLIFDKLCKKSSDRHSDQEDVVWRLICENLTALGSLKLAFQTQLESIRDRLKSLRAKSESPIDLSEFFIKQVKDDSDAVASVVQLLNRSQNTGCDHALDSLTRCLRALSNVKFNVKLFNKP